jgi:hypothetical protein
MTQTDAEIVARAVQSVSGFDLTEGERRRMAAAVVAALTEAGRLVPDGCVAIPRYQWDRVKTGDLDAGPTT